MATPLEALQNRRIQLDNSVNSSNTSYGTTGVAPSFSDVSKDKQLSSIDKQLEDLKSTQLRNKYYGSDTTSLPTPVQEPSNYMKVVTAIQKPLNAELGAIQYALGKGTESSLSANINKSMKEGRTWGNLLAQYNVPRWLQVGGGFALDVFTDPVNMITGGTQSLLPRIGTGLVKGGIKEGVPGAFKAAGKGFTSYAEKAGATAMNFVPFVKKAGQKAKTATEAGLKPSFLGKAAEGYTDLAGRLSKKAIASAEKYDNLIGKTVLDDLGKVPLTGISSGAVGDLAEKLVKKIPSLKIGKFKTWDGEKLIDFMKYSTTDAAKAVKLKQTATDLAKEKLGVNLVGEKIADFPTIGAFEDINATIKWPVSEVTVKSRKAAKNAVEGADAVAGSEPEFVNRLIRQQEGPNKGQLVEGFKGQVSIANTKDNARAILDSYGQLYEDRLLSKAYSVRGKGTTGFTAYDNALEKLKKTTLGGIVNATSRRFGGNDVFTKVTNESNELITTWNKYGTVMDLKPFNKFLEWYPQYISAFKLAKVAMNTGSHVIANIGNFFMGAMMGLPVANVNYLNEVVTARKLVAGKLGYQGIVEQLNVFEDLIKKDPGQFRALTGMDPSELSQKIKLGDKILSVESIFGEAKKTLVSEWGGIEEAVSKAQSLDDLEKVNTLGKGKAIDKSLSTGTKTMENMAKEGTVYGADQTTSFSSMEITDLDFAQKMKDSITKKLATNPNNVGYKALDFMLNRMPIAYERIDQGWKIGTTNYLTKFGLTRKELMVISRSVPIEEADLLEPLISGAEKMYRLTPYAASRVAMEAFMNYSAMPDFVKLTRAMPFVGSSFFSFPYAMAVKMGKTAVDNPAIFNKVAFMMNEMNAGRTPQERQALESKYNEYMKSPTVVKVMGMWNTNVKNLIPYYSMNMFNPSERNYDVSSTPGKIFQMTDKLPFFQDPIGQVIKDYMIQPWMLSGTVAMPQGQFGQPLYPSFDANGKPIDVGMGTKALYAGKSIFETVVPGVVGYTGALNAITGLGPEVVNKLPLGYAFSGIANATQGRSSIGAKTSMDAFRKTLTTVISRTGIPYYNLDPNISSGQ